MGADPLNPLNPIQLYSAATINDREERFIDLEKANAERLYDIYTGSINTLPQNSLVLCDNFTKRRTGTANNKKTGMPILYYRANTRYKIQDSSRFPQTIFDFRDNAEVLALGLADDRSNHDLDNSAKFDEAIINTQINIQDIPVPYRAQSFILLSAGKDGIYGTGDDIFNFDKEK